MKKQTEAEALPDRQQQQQQESWCQDNNNNNRSGNCNAKTEEQKELNKINYTWKSRADSRCQAKSLTLCCLHWHWRPPEWSRS